GAGTLMLREAVTGPVIGGQKGYAGDYGPAIEAWLDTPGGIVVAPDGDIYIADSNNDVIRRIDAKNTIWPVAGNHDLGSGYSGDGGPATEAQLDTQDGVASIPRIDAKTCLIHTVAGNGGPGDNPTNVGDGGPAASARLNMPSDVAVAPNRDLYIADMHHNRIRKVDAITHIITTVAGSGVWG